MSNMDKVETLSPAFDNFFAQPFHFLSDLHDKKHLTFRAENQVLNLIDVYSIRFGLSIGKIQAKIWLTICRIVSGGIGGKTVNGVRYRKSVVRIKGNCSRNNRKPRPYSSLRFSIRAS